MPSRHLVVFWLLLIACGLALAATPALGREAIVTLANGQHFKGEVVSDTDASVTLNIAGITTPFPRVNSDPRLSIDTVEYIPTIEEQYATRRAEIADDDLDKRYELAYWLYENRAYRLAQREVADLLKRFPTAENLKSLATDIDQKIKLEDEPRGADITTRPAYRATYRPPPRNRAGLGNVPGVAQELTDQQINTIRVYEINPNEQTQPRVMVPDKVIDKLFTDYADRDIVPKGPRAQLDFRHSPGWVQLRLLFALRARELYPQVQVLDEPPMINSFKSINQSYIVNYCGTPQCHGGEKAGNFFLFRADAYSMRTVYTNYYIVYSYETKNGYMIDLTRPRSSYLLQYGLPVSYAKFAHPAVRGWAPYFPNGIDDPRYQPILDWINQLSPPRQKYPINYTAPTLPSPPNADNPDSAANPANSGDSSDQRDTMPPAGNGTPP